MDNNLPKLMEHQIIKDVIQQNLPPYLQMKFIEAGGQKQSLAEVMTIMKDLEMADAVHSKECKCKEESKQRDGKKGSEKGDNKNGNGKDKNKKSQGNSNQGKGGNNKSKCLLPGHNHNWLNCFNNTKSPNYIGTSHKVISKNSKEKNEKKQKGMKTMQSEVKMGEMTVTLNYSL